MTATEAEVIIPGTGTPKLNKALSQLQGELPQIKKTKTAKIKYQDKAGVWNSHEYSYADLGDVVADVGPLLAKHGLAFHCAPTINPADRREMLLLWSLLHESGEEKSGEWPLGPVNQKPQSLGSAITYGRRYCFTAATNIVLEDDDDGQRAQQDHGGGQAAGDAWESATPAKPRQGQGQAPARDKDTRDDDAQPWHARALKQAQDGKFKSEAEAWKLYREASARTIAGDATPDQQDHVQNAVAKWVRGQRRKLSDRLLQQLPDADDWRAKVEELDGDDIQACREALAEVGRLKVAGTMDEARAERIGRAVIALCPKAALKGDDGA